MQILIYRCFIVCCPWVSSVWREVGFDWFPMLTSSLHLKLFCCICKQIVWSILNISVRPKLGLSCHVLAFEGYCNYYLFHSLSQYSNWFILSHDLLIFFQVALPSQIWFQLHIEVLQETIYMILVLENICIYRILMSHTWKYTLQIRH